MNIGMHASYSHSNLQDKGLRTSDKAARTE